MLVIVQNVHFVPSSALMLTRLSDDALESVLVPLDGLDLVDTVAGTDSAPATPALGNALTGSGHAAVEIHAVNTVQG